MMYIVLLVFIQNCLSLLELKTSAWKLSDYENQHEIPDCALCQVVYKCSENSLLQ